MVKRALIEQFADAEIVVSSPLPGIAPQGSVVWITGLSGAGKTTIAEALKARLERQGQAPILLDGDTLRGLFANGDKFDAASRLELARNYGRLCQMLAKQGQTVICATISMRQPIYDWNRKNLPNYVEVFLDVPLETRQARDPKGYYAALHNGALNDFAGQDQAVDLPPSPDVHIKPDTEKSPDEICDLIEAALAETLAVKG